MMHKAKIADVYLIYNRYHDDSIKGLRRFNCDTRAGHVYHATMYTPKYVILKVFESKEQLIQLIFNDLFSNAVSVFLHKLTVTEKILFRYIYSMDIYPIAKTYEQLRKKLALS